MKPLLIIIKTLIIGYFWSIIFIDGIRVLMLINWHFDIFIRAHWQYLRIRWNNGNPMSKSELCLVLLIVSSFPLWFSGWVGLCLVKWKKLLKNIMFGPLYLYRKLTLKTKAPIVVKKKSIAEEAPVIKKTPIIKKTQTKRPALPSATLMQSRQSGGVGISRPSIPSATPYQAASKKSPESPTTHALFNFDDDDFELDFDFEKKEDKSLEDNIPSALVVDKKPEIQVSERTKEEQPKQQANPQSQNQKNKNNDKPQQNQRRDAEKKVQQSSQTSNQQQRESHTPVLDVLNQKGYDVISSAIIKNIQIDFIGVSKNQLILCLVDKEIGDWLADEEKFNDEEPLWFSESSHRISPVRQIDVARDILKSRLAVADMNFEIVSYVIIQSGNIINAEDMFEIWDNMHISVTRINRGSPKEIRLFSKTIETCEEKIDKNTLDKLRKFIISLA